VTQEEPSLAPGAALHDPELRQLVQRMRGSGRSGERETGRCLEGLLGQYPWQEYGYKAGRWERTDSAVGLFGLWRWSRTYQVFQVIDPRGGSPLAELRDPDGAALAPPEGSVWIAGDPRVAAAYSPAGDGKRTVRLAVSPFVPQAEAMEFAATARPGDRPPFALVRYEERFPYGGSTWLTDCPGKPTRSQGYSWNSTSY